MAELYVTHESPVRIILETDPDWKAETSKTYASSVKQGRSCLAICAAASLFVLAILGYSFSARSLGSLPWSFWVLAVLVLVGTALFTVIETAFRSSHRNDADEATVTIDLDSQQAVRVEKLNSGQNVRYELDLGRVTRVLIHGDDAIHTLTVKLESGEGP